MSYEQDYIKRMLQKMGEVLARALGLAKRGDFDESFQALEQGVGAELGLPFAMLLRLEPKALVSLLGPAKAAAFAEAMRTRSLLFELAERPVDARLSRNNAEAIEALLARVPPDAAVEPSGGAAR